LYEDRVQEAKDLPLRAKCRVQEAKYVPLRAKSGLTRSRLTRFDGIHITGTDIKRAVQRLSSRDSEALVHFQTVEQNNLGFKLTSGVA
jgi:hypothetical protein